MKNSLFFYNIQGHKELVDHIVEVCEMDLTNHSKYYDLHESVHVALQRIVTSLSTEKVLAVNELMDLVGTELRQNGRVFEAAVHHLHAKVRLIFWFQDVKKACDTLALFLGTFLK